MERIQSAIQKARKAREQSSPEQQDFVSEKATALATGVPQATPARETEGSKHFWRELPKLHLQPKTLRNAQIVTDQAGGATAPFDALRTRMLHQMRANKWSRIAITSPGSACGKTTLCMNLAFALARQRDLRTLVVDLDMRKPSIAQALGLAQQLNFPDALRGNSAPEEHMVCYDEKLIFAVTRQPAESPAELLQEKGAAHVIDDLEARYMPNVILFDTPPMLACDDTFAFLDQIDGVLLVAAAENTTLEELEKCKQEIETRSNLMGVVLNKCRYLNREDSYGY